MDIKNPNEVPSFITKDGSEIRELLAHRNSAIRNQSLAGRDCRSAGREICSNYYSQAFFYCAVIL